MGTARAAVHIRRVYNEEDTMAMVERLGGPDEVHHVVGRRDSVRARGGVFHQPVLLPELRHTVVVAREVAAHGRLPLRVETELRPAHTADTPHDAAHAAHAAAVRVQVVHRVPAMGLPQGEGHGQGGAQRHRGVQLPRRRHDMQRAAVAGAGLLPAVLRLRLPGIRQGGGGGLANTAAAVGLFPRDLCLGAEVSRAEPQHLRRH